MSLITIGMHPLLTEAVIKMLHTKNIRTIVDFATSEVKQISTITSLSYKEILALQKYLIHKYSAVIRNGCEYYLELIEKTALIPTGIKKFDEILEGGLLTGNVYEVCGLPASGKTQFCLTLTKNVVHNLNLFTYYIDTKRNFSGRKMKTILESGNNQEVQIGDIMSKILVARVYSHHKLVSCLYKIIRELNNGLKLRLIIIDSLPPLFYHSNDSTQTNRGILNHFVNVMHFMAKEYHIAFIVINLMTTWYEGNFSIEKSFIETIGLGKYWYNIPNYRIMIKPFKTECGKCELVVMKSNKHLEVKSCIVNI